MARNGDIWAIACGFPVHNTAFFPLPLLSDEPEDEGWGRGGYSVRRALRSAGRRAGGRSQAFTNKLSP